MSLVGQSLGAAIAARSVVEALLPVDRLIVIGAAGAPEYESAGGTPRSTLSDLSAPSYDLVKRRLEYAMLSRGSEMDELIECRFRAYQLGDWADRVRAFNYYEEPKRPQDARLCKRPQPVVRAARRSQPRCTSWRVPARPKGRNKHLSAGNAA